MYLYSVLDELTLFPIQDLTGVLTEGLQVFHLLQLLPHLVCIWILSNWTEVTNCWHDHFILLGWFILVHIIYDDYIG